VTTPRRALLVSDQYTFLDSGQVVPTPADSFTAGLPGLLARVAATFDREGALLLDGRGAAKVGLPTSPEAYAEPIQEHPALAGVLAAGWKSGRETQPELRPWTTFHRDGAAAVHVGILPAIDPVRSPVVRPWPQDTVAACALWHHLTGSAYHGTPGVAGTAILRANAAGGEKDGKPQAPRWQVHEGQPEGSLIEADYKPEQWKGLRPKGHRHAFGLDCYRMYLGGMLACPLTPYRLRQTGKMRAYEPDRAGWFLADIAKWGDRRMPDPAGYSKTDGPRWVTGPTLGLLDQLIEEGVHGGYEILDSWTGPVISAAGGRPLRPVAEILRDAAVSPLLTGPEDGTTYRYGVELALKQAYREMWGLLDSPTALVQRRDWHFGGLAMSRANLFRRLWKIGHTEDRWPLWIDVDEVWYSGPTPDVHDACPKGITLIEGDETPGLGKFRFKGNTVTLEARRGTR
jgi:hypothetical protein